MYNLTEITTQSLLHLYNYDLVITDIDVTELILAKVLSPLDNQIYSINQQSLYIYLCQM